MPSKVKWPLLGRLPGLERPGYQGERKAAEKFRLVGDSYLAARDKSCISKEEKSSGKEILLRDIVLLHQQTPAGRRDKTVNLFGQS